MKTNTIFLVGKCNCCWKDVYSTHSFVVLANRKRLCWDCYSNNLSLKSSPNSA